MAAAERADEALMIAYKKGDTAAFEVLVKRHQRPVYNFVLRHIGNRALADDLLQEVFLRVVRSATTYETEAKFTTWLYTIARNLCVDHLRRAKHRKALSLDQPIGGDDAAGATLGDMTADERPGVEREVSSHQLRARLERAIDRLGEEQREVFLMRELLNLPFKEIAAIVGAPENTIKSRMRYALEHLRTELEEYEEMAQALN